MNWDNLANSFSWYCASAMQSESKLGLSDIIYFSSCKCIIYSRTGVFGILGCKNVPDVVGPLANVWYKCCFIDSSIESVSVQCYIRVKKLVQITYHIENLHGSIHHWGAD